MAGRRGVLVGERPFATRAEAIQYLQDLRDKYGRGNSVTDADDRVFLSDLIAMHPDAEQKIGAGMIDQQLSRIAELYEVGQYTREVYERKKADLLIERDSLDVVPASVSVTSSVSASSRSWTTGKR
jgi:hypothetical protein